MSRLKPNKLHVRYLEGATPAGPIVPRKYTLTHSDRTGDLFLTVGPDYDRKQISGWYTRWMRDEVLGEWVRTDTGYTLCVDVHVSGGKALGTAKWRNGILHKEMPLVLEAIAYAERNILQTRPELKKAEIQVHFHSNKKKFDTIETWDTIGHYLEIVI